MEIVLLAHSEFSGLVTQHESRISSSNFVFILVTMWEGGVLLLFRKHESFSGFLGWGRSTRIKYFMRSVWGRGMMECNSDGVTVCWHFVVT